MAADGSILIDTHIDQKGIGKSVQGLSKSLTGILNIVKGIGKALVAAFVGGTIISAFRSIFQSFDILGSAVGEKFKPLVDAIETLKGSLVNLLVQALVPAIPYLVEFANWLTNILQLATQVVATFFGFDKTVGGIMNKAAAGAKKTAKEAKGALAAFDQINLLQKQEKPETPEGASVTPGPMAITQEAKEIADTIKDWVDNPVEEFKKFVFWDNWVAFFEGVIDALKQAWEDFKDFIFLDNWTNLFERLVANWKDTWIKVWENTKETFQKIKENILLALQGVKEFLVGAFTGDWQQAWQGLTDIVNGVFGALTALITGIVNNWMIYFEGLINNFAIAFGPVLDWLAEKFSGIIEGIKTAWGTLAQWFFENVWNPIEAGFGSALTGIRQGFEKTFNGIKTFIKGVINNIIDFINGMIEGIVFGINTVIGSANAVSGLVGLPEIQSISAPKIPRLATGAVIPPNSEFLAVLGDQRSGKNIEAPAAMFEQMLERAVQSGGGGDITIPITLTLDGETVYRSQKRVSTRHGKSLIASGVTR